VAHLRYPAQDPFGKLGGHLEHRGKPRKVAEEGGLEVQKPRALPPTLFRLHPSLEVGKEQVIHPLDLQGLHLGQKLLHRQAVGLVAGRRHLHPHHLHPQGL